MDRSEIQDGSFVTALNCNRGSRSRAPPESWIALSGVVAPSNIAYRITKKEYE
jgi:hypothetical protein